MEVDFRNDHFSKVFADPPDPFPAPVKLRKGFEGEHQPRR